MDQLLVPLDKNVSVSFLVHAVSFYNGEWAICLPQGLFCAEKCLKKEHINAA